MTLDFDEHGRLDMVAKKVNDFLDDQIFRFPEYANQIAGIRGGITGVCVGLSPDAVGTIQGHLFCDGSMVDSNVQVNLTQV